MLQGMVHMLVTLDVVSWNVGISTCEKGELWEEAHRLLQEMGQ